MISAAVLLMMGWMASVRADHAHYTSYFSGSSQNATGYGKGGAVLMGGGTDVDEAFHFLHQQGGGGDMLVLRASGADGYNDYLMDLVHPNSVESVVFHDRQASFDPEVVAKIDNAEAIFMAGGDQSKYLRYWRDTPVQSALQRAILRGVPLGGTSAGLAVLGDHIFAAHQGGYESEFVLADPTSPKITVEEALVDLPFMHQTFTDTHFSQRDRMGRLCGFLARVNQDPNWELTRGLGVDEATAVLVEADGQARVVGQNSAYFVTPGGPPETYRPGQPLTYRDLQVIRLEAGQSIDLKAWDGPKTTLNVVNGQLSR